MLVFFKYIWPSVSVFFWLDLLFNALRVVHNFQPFCKCTNHIPGKRGYNHMYAFYKCRSHEFVRNLNTVHKAPVNHYCYLINPIQCPFTQWTKAS